MDQVFLTVAVNPTNTAGLRAALQRLIEMLPDGPAGERLPGDPPGGTFVSLSWPYERLMQLRDWIRPTSKAWLALVQIAEQPEGCPRELLLSSLGIDVRDLPGTLSPIGKFNKKFHHGHLPLPYEQRDLLFTMEPRLARMIQRLAGGPEPAPDIQSR